LLSAVIDELLITLQIFERQGFEPFAEEWRRNDALRDASVRVLCANEIVNGIARGSAADGALLVEVDGKVQRFVSGDVSLRAA
jgi:BirA family biotin operon repressor/biotin-[acetyl-CoA-carboxylase] ligase